MRQDCEFFCPIRVRYAEVDQQGIVYNANYMTYMDVAFGEYTRHKGYPYRQLTLDTGFEVCHVKSEVTFKSSAFDDDLLEIGVRVLRVGEKSFTLGFEIYRQGSDELLVDAACVYAGYSSKNRTSRPLSDEMRRILTS